MSIKKINPAYLFFGLALLLYGLTGSRYPFPGESSALLVSQSGISPFPLHLHPIWSFIMRFFRLLPIPLAMTANAFSALCGAAALGMFYNVMKNINLDSDYDENTPGARTVMCIAGSLYLLALLPIWMVCNRTHYASFDFLLFIFGVRLLQNYETGGGQKYLYGLAALFGLGVVESSTLLITFPVVGIYTFFLMWKNNDLRRMPITFSISAFLLAFSTHFLQAWYYTTLPVYDWGGAKNFWHAAWLTYTSSARLLVNQIPEVGWIILLIFILLPFVGSMWIRKAQLGENRTLSIVFIAMLVTLLSISLLFNIGIASWMLVPASRNFILPGVLLAVSFALSTGFWFAVLKNRAQENAETSGEDRKRLEMFFVVLLVALTVIAAFMNYEKIKKIGNAKLYRLASSMVKTLPPRDMILTFKDFPSALSPYLAIAASDQGIDCDIIDLGLVNYPIYTKYIKSVVETPRLSSLAEYSLPAMVHEWIKTTPGIERKLALTTMEFWGNAGFAAVPSYGLYYGMNTNELNAERLFEDNREFRELAVKHLSVSGNPGDREDILTTDIAFYISKNINNFGVLMEYLERPNLSVAPYETAIKINKYAISSILNLYTTHEENVNKPALRSQLEGLVKKLSGTQLRELLNRTGYIRKREALQTMKDLLAATHPPEKITPSPPPSPEEQADIEKLKDAVKNVKERKYDEAITLCRQLVEKNANYDKAWSLLGVLSYQKGDMKTLDECVERMVVAREFWPNLVFVDGERALKKGELKKAANAYGSLLSLTPSNISLLEKMLMITETGGGLRKSKVYLKRLLMLDSGNYQANYTLGNIHSRKGDYDLAISAYNKCMERVKEPSILNNIAWCLNREGEHEKALKFILESLKMSNNIPSSWDTLFEIYFDLGRYDDAKDAINSQLELQPDSVSVRINKLKLHVREGDMDAAHKLANELKLREPPIGEKETDEIDEIFKMRN